MTTPTSIEAQPVRDDPPAQDVRGDDQLPAGFGYGHGRMPIFMKIAWLAFLAFGAWYTVTYLLAALADEVN